MTTLGGFATGFAVSLALVPPLAAFARRVGWLDPPRGFRGDPSLKRQSEPVPPVGGVPMLLLAFATSAHAPGLSAPALASILLAFLVGLLDDVLLGGLAPWPKVAGQALAALPFACFATSSPLAGVGFLLLALVALNAANLFDHTDGFCALLAVFGLVRAAPGLAGAAAGFLPWNLARRSSGAQHAFLGDAGSHTVGMAIAVHPASWTVLLIPLLDVVRLSVQRTLRGSRPWIGDRGHLGHVLERRGVGPVGRCVLLALALAWVPFV